LQTSKIEENKKDIREILTGLFIDGNEYRNISYTKDEILACVRIEQPDPEPDWKNIYSVFTKGRKVLKTCYEGYNGYGASINGPILSTREICENKFKKSIEECLSQKELPAYLDRKSGKYRIVYDLNIFEKVFGRFIGRQSVALKNNITLLGKTGGNLRSGKSARVILRDIEPNIKELAYKKKKNDD
jgi:hypothetical protein